MTEQLNWTELIPIRGHVQGFFHSLLWNSLPPLSSLEKYNILQGPVQISSPLKCSGMLPWPDRLLSPQCSRFRTPVCYRAWSMLGSGSFSPPLPCLGVPRWPGWGCVLVSHPSPSSYRSCINTWWIKFQNCDIWLSLLLSYLSRDPHLHFAIFSLPLLLLLLSRFSRVWLCATP